MDLPNEIWYLILTQVPWKYRIVCKLWHSYIECKLIEMIYYLDANRHEKIERIMKNYLGPQIGIINNTVCITCDCETINYFYLPRNEDVYCNCGKVIDCKTINETIGIYNCLRKFRYNLPIFTNLKLQPKIKIDSWEFDPIINHVGYRTKDDFKNITITYKYINRYKISWKQPIDGNSKSVLIRNLNSLIRKDFKTGVRLS
jgi:hypothetical protein